MKLLKEIVYSTECDLYAVTETNLKQNENIVVKGYKWVGKMREERNGGRVAILIKATLINGIKIEPITAKKIEILLLKLNLNNSQYLVIMIYYGKQESRANKEEALAEFKNIETIIECYLNQKYHTLLIADFNAKIGRDEKGIQNGNKQVSRNGIMLRALIEKYDLTVVNNEPICSGKWTRISTTNQNQKFVLDYAICTSPLKYHIQEMINDEEENYRLKGSLIVYSSQVGNFSREQLYNTFYTKVSKTH